MSNFVHMDDESINKLVTLKKAENEIYVMTLLVKTFTMDLFRAINYHLDFLEFETDGPMHPLSSTTGHFMGNLNTPFDPPRSDLLNLLLKKLVILFLIDRKVRAGSASPTQLMKP